MLKRALEEFSLPPERAMMVGDSLRDVEAAKDLGVTGYLISSDSPSSLRLSARIVSSFSAAVEDFLTEKNLLLPERSPHVS
jgi:D-glycero-D-manno-heptose 1,7-bisphosphate phosphatase